MYKKLMQNGFILNMELHKPLEFLERASIAKYINDYHKVHSISMISEEEYKIYENVEEECKVFLDELPSIVASVLI